MGIKIKNHKLTKVKDVDDFDDDVFIKRLSVSECKTEDGDTIENTGHLIMARALVDKSGNRFYKDNEVGLMLSDIPIRAMKALNEQVNRVNGVDEKKPKTKPGDSSTD